MISRISWQKYGLTLAGLAILLLAHLKYVHHLGNITDLVMADECGSIRNAMALGWHFIARDGLVYFLWYKFLLLFAADPVVIYVLNRALLMGANIYIFFLIWKRLGAHYLVAVVGAVLFMVSDVNDAWPFVTQFALLIILLTFYVSLRFQRWQEIILAWNIGFYLLSYTRPEFTPLFLFFLLVNILGVLYQIYTQWRRKYKISWSSPGIICLALIAGFLILGSPMRGNRSLVAFGQHFALNQAAADQSDINPWTQWEVILKKEFPTAQTLPGLVSENPSAFLKHVKANFQQIQNKLTFAFRPAEVTSEYFKQIYKTLARLALVVLLWVMVTNLVRAWKVKSLAPQRGYFMILIYSLVVSFPILASMIIIYPREHYLLMMAGLIYLLVTVSIVQVIPSLKFKEPWHRMVFEIAVVGLILYWVPFKASGLPGFEFKHSNNIHQAIYTNTRLIHDLRKVDWPEKTVLLSAKGMVGFCVDPRILNIPEYDKKPGFVDFIQARQINAILVTEGLLKDIRFASDEEFLGFLLDHDGFEKKTIHDQVTLYLKKDRPE